MVPWKYINMLIIHCSEMKYKNNKPIIIIIIIIMIVISSSSM